MIKTIAIPQNNSYNITIPNSYIGKKIEILVYALDELSEEKSVSKKKPSDFFGTLTKEEGEKFHTYIKKTREEWGRNI